MNPVNYSVYAVSDDITPKFNHESFYTLRTKPYQCVFDGRYKTSWSIMGNVIQRDSTQNGLGISEELSPTLNTVDRHAVAYSFDSMASNSMKSANPLSGCRVVECSKTVDTTDQNPSKNQGGIAVVEQPVTLHENQRSEIRYDTVFHPLSVGGGKPGQGYPAIMKQGGVRKLTPVECERLMGFPDDWTNVPYPAVFDIGEMQCDKQIVRATIKGKGKTYYVATNHKTHAVDGCPRRGMASGEGYDLCQQICGQEHHAEIRALKLAGAKAKGAVMYVEGHSYACASCKAAAEQAGITEIIFGAPPVDCSDGVRYAACGNSIVTNVMEWLGLRIKKAFEEMESRK